MEAVAASSENANSYSEQWFAALDTPDKGSRLEVLDDLLAADDWKAQLDELAERCGEANVEINLAGDIRAMMRTRKALAPNVRSALAGKAQKIQDNPSASCYMTDAQAGDMWSAFLKTAVSEQAAKTRGISKKRRVTKSAAPAAKKRS